MHQQIPMVSRHLLLPLLTFPVVLFNYLAPSPFTLVLPRKSKVLSTIIFQHFDSLYYCTLSYFTISKAPYPNSGSFIGSILYDPERMKLHHEYGLLVSFFNVGTVR